MKVSQVSALIACALLIVAIHVCLAGDRESDAALGERLVRTVFTHGHKKAVSELDKFLAQGYQSIHWDGARTRQEELELIKGLNYKKKPILSGFSTTRNGPVIVVTYFISVEETIGGKKIFAEKAPRLSVFLHTDAGWRWIAHANLSVPSESK